MHLYSSLLRKCQHQTKQLWRGFSHRTEGGPWPQKGVLTYFLASQPLLMPGGPSPPTKQKVCPLLQKGKLPDTHFSCSFAAWLWGESQAHQWCTAPQASSRCWGWRSLHSGTVVTGLVSKTSCSSKSLCSPQPPGLSICCANCRGQGLGGESGGLWTSSRAAFRVLFLLNCLAESELPGVCLV